MSGSAIEALLGRAARLLAVFCLVAAAASVSADEVEDFTLGPGDIIEISVLEDPALGRQVLVRPDGKFSMPLAGTVNAFGRTPEEVQRTIRSRLRDNFIEPPTVTVAVISVSTEEEDELDLRVVYILGEVPRPGRFEYEPEDRMTILQALSMAGGPGPFAARKRIQVRETEDDIETVKLIDYDAIENGAAADLTEIADGAVIIVPERGFLE